MTYYNYCCSENSFRKTNDKDEMLAKRLMFKYGIDFHALFSNSNSLKPLDLIIIVIITL